jgi:hypothetical protein
MNRKSSKRDAYKFCSTGAKTFYQVISKERIQPFSNSNFNPKIKIKFTRRNGLPIYNHRTYKSELNTYECLCFRKENSKTTILLPGKQTDAIKNRWAHSCTMHIHIGRKM